MSIEQYVDEHESLDRQTEQVQSDTLAYGEGFVDFIGESTQDRLARIAEARAEIDSIFQAA